MRALRSETSASIFSNTRGTTWTGGVYCVERNKECVPIIVDEKRFIVEFNIPYFLTNGQFYEDILIPLEDGGKFTPKLDHRLIDVLAVGENGELLNLCAVASKDRPSDSTALVGCLQAAVLTYYRSSPHANQYFFRTDVNTRSVLQSTITNLPEGLRDKYTVESHDGLAEPYFGFSIVSNAL